MIIYMGSFHTSPFFDVNHDVSLLFPVLCQVELSKIVCLRTGSAVSYIGQHAPFSHYSDYIDITAPGVQIASTFFNQQYAALSGTSMASPHVTGLAGLLLSVNPHLTNREVMDIIKNTAYDLGIPGTDNDFGSGLIDVKNALETAQNP
jgi:thermitase